jgi:ABC-type transport system involved in cytochrome bd biosynthesis fused ATPase/permease subunit
VDFANVSFAYPARPDVPVLRGISLQVLHGQTVGIVGSSGSGKSTLLALMERFYDAQAGNLDVFGAPAASYNLAEYRKRLAYVPQEPRLYKGKLRMQSLLGTTLTVHQARYTKTLFSASTKPLSQKTMSPGYARLQTWPTWLLHLKRATRPNVAQALVLPFPEARSNVLQLLEP